MHIEQFVKFSRKIVCVGRNFGAHAKELGNAIPTKPVIFLKPPSSFIRAPGPISIPKTLKELHHEVELALVIGKDARNVQTDKEALNCIAGYALSLDMTARDVQNEAKKAGLPWTEAKGYDTFTPISDFIPSSMVNDPHNIDLWCHVNEDLRQKGNTRDMIFSIPEIIKHISRIMTLSYGDVILTGTPSGVGPVKPGDTILCGMSGDGMTSEVNMKFNVE